MLVLLQIGPVEHGFATLALHPQPFRNTAAIRRVGFLNFWGQQFFKPTHEGTPKRYAMGVLRTVGDYQSNNWAQHFPKAHSSSSTKVNGR